MEYDKGLEEHYLRQIICETCPVNYKCYGQLCIQGSDYVEERLKELKEIVKNYKQKNQ